MKKTFIIILILTNSVCAFECKTPDIKGTTIYTTMSSTYSEDNDIKSMWFESRKVVKKKLIETTKEKIEVQGPLFKTTQFVSYDGQGNTKQHQIANDWEPYKEPIPQSIGEWKRNMVLTGSYLLDDAYFDKKEQNENCTFFGEGILPKDENGNILLPFHTRQQQ